MSSIVCGSVTPHKSLFKNTTTHEDGTLRRNNIFVQMATTNSCDCRMANGIIQLAAATAALFELLITIVFVGG